MGRIKTSFVKRVGHELFEGNEAAYSEDFAQNKLVVKENARITSKKLLNIITGYITTLKKLEQKKV